VHRVTHVHTTYNSPYSSVRPTQRRIADDETPVTSNNFFKIVIVLDESGSMGNIKDKMRNSINDLINEQKQVKGRPATFTLVKFNDRVNRVIKNKPLDQIDSLASDDYTPDGPTALYDAIGNTISWFRNEKDVLMVIVTDGQENASTRYDKYSVNELIDEKKRNNNWSYVYLSCDLSTFDQGNRIGLRESSLVSNCVVSQEKYGDFISNRLNSAISNCRRTGASVQSQLNH
jgi:Mg-chelatase subunit ChlD